MQIEIRDEPHLAPLVHREAVESYGFQSLGVEKPGSGETDLSHLSLEFLFPSGFSNQRLAACCLSGVWLLHNRWHESHEISQTIKTPEGSLWHGIMHRLEGDFWNSKYWYRQAGRHSAFDGMFERIDLDSQDAQLPERMKELSISKWNPEPFVDLCESCNNNEAHPDFELCRIVAQLEWLSLFDFCYENAQ